MTADELKDIVARINRPESYSMPRFGLPQDQHDAEIRAALKVSSAKARAGAAIVASRLSLYAALLKVGAAPAAGEPRVQLNR